MGSRLGHAHDVLELTIVIQFGGLGRGQGARVVARQEVADPLSGRLRGTEGDHLCGTTLSNEVNHLFVGQAGSHAA